MGRLSSPLSPAAGSKGFHLRGFPAEPPQRHKRSTKTSRGCLGEKYHPPGLPQSREARSRQPSPPLLPDFALERKIKQSPTCANPGQRIPATPGCGSPGMGNLPPEPKRHLTTAPLPERTHGHLRGRPGLSERGRKMRRRRRRAPRPRGPRCRPGDKATGQPRGTGRTPVPGQPPGKEGSGAGGEAAAAVGAAPAALTWPRGSGRAGPGRAPPVAAHL